MDWGPHPPFILLRYTLDALWAAPLDDIFRGNAEVGHDVFQRAYAVTFTFLEDVCVRPNRSQGPLDSRRGLFGMGVSVLMLFDKHHLTNVQNKFVN